MGEKDLLIECNNIGKNEIQKLIEFYNIVDKEKSYEVLVKFSKTLEVTFGEVDQLFFSYLILFISDTKKSSCHFDFGKNPVFSKRAYSLKHQLEHIRFILNLSESQLSLNGKSQDKYNKISDISLYSFNDILDKSTGEILSDNINDIHSLKLKQSQYFIPPIFITQNRESINRYFSVIPNDGYLSILLDKYKNEIHRIVTKFGFNTNERSKEEPQKFILEELKLETLSFVELSIYLLLINEDTYLPLGGTGVSGINRISRQAENRKRYIPYIKYVKEIASGLKELALNINEHSTTKKGVITARVYDKKRLKVLKGIDSVENVFFSKRETTKFTTQKNEQFLLDINVIDFGTESVRDKYITNIKNNSYKNLSKEQVQNDTQIIKKNYQFKDFFIIDFSKYKELNQYNKLISRYGLHHFTFVIKDSLNGFVKVSTTNKKNKDLIENEAAVFFDDFQQDISLTNDYFKNGTTYNCLIPLQIIFKKENDAENSDKYITKKVHSISSFQELDDFEFLEFNQQIKDKSKQPIYNFSRKYVKDFVVEEKYESIGCVYNSLITEVTKRDAILCIDARNIEIKNESNWVRLLSTINYYYKDIVVYNIENQITYRIKELRRHYRRDRNNIDFWSKDSRVLFYSTKTSIDKLHTRYGATILAGTTIEEYNYLNKYIERHRYSFYEENPGEYFYSRLQKDTKVPNKSVVGNKLFTNNNLKYLELIIPNQDEKNDRHLSLFEQSVQYSLNKPFEPEELRPEKDKETNNQGYKIENTHFRLGSKIHIRDFYYAKRLFQNSFFTTPIAYLIATHIYPKLEAGLNYSLVGYENYSSYLVSTVRNLLEKKLRKKSRKIKINHTTISKDGITSRGIKLLNNNTILIVPIASTFSTSIKIKKDIDGIFKRFDDKVKIESKKIGIQNVVDYVNVVLVGDESIKERESTNGIIDFHKEQDKIVTIFNWKSLNLKDKIIHIEESGGETTSQKYFIPLYTKWELAEDCVQCFPENIIDETCLIETGSASITPKLIFGMPKTKPSNSYGKNKLDLENSLLYGNLKLKNNNYLYFTRTATVINKSENKNRIVAWLKQLKQNIFTNIENEKIVIVTPSSGSKSNFLDLVNEYVFDYTANCVVISLEEDYIENADSLYSDGLFNAKKVVFVDDVLSTVNSFLEVNYIVKYIRKKIDGGGGIDYCISLINRMSYDSENNVLLKLIPLVNNEYQRLHHSFSEITKKIQETKLLQRESKEKNLEKISRNKQTIDELCEQRNDLESVKILSKAEDKLLYFTKIYNPTIEEPNNDFPLEKERERYGKLANISSLDAIRKLFFNKKNALKPHNLSKPIPDEIKDFENYRNKKLYQLLVLDSLYTLFNFKDGSYIHNDKMNEIFVTGKLFPELKKYVESELEKEKVFYKKIIHNYENNLEFTILKIICSTPLVYYKEIRESAFKWVIEKLQILRYGNLVDFQNNRTKERIIGLENINKKDEYLLEYFEVNSNNYYSEYQKLKFLLKRAVELKGNYIIHSDFFKSISKLIEVLFDRGKKLKKHKLENDINFKKKVEDLLKSKKYVEVTDLLQYIAILEKSHLFPKNFFEKELKSNNFNEKKESDYSTLTNSSDLFNLPDDRKDFEKSLLDLKKHPKYSITTGKDFIYYLVALVQELVLDHETKSIKLKENTNQFIGIDNKGVIVNVELYKEFLRNLKNGDFLHYIRLLKLENTEVIESYWKDYKKRELKNSVNKKINSNNIIFEKGTKYKLAIRLSKKEDLEKFIEIRAELHNKTQGFNNKVLVNGINKDESIKTFIRERILNKMALILGNVRESYLTINYNEKKNSIEKNDLYTFKGDDNYEINILAKLEKSLTLQMFNGIEDLESNAQNNGEFTLSHLEIYKQTKRSELIFRQNIDINKGELSELEKLKDEDKCNILVLRISGFTEPNETLQKRKKKLYTQAVFTFYIDDASRISEEKLRLLLLLRKPLSKFLKNEISTNTFLELLNLDNIDKVQSDLKHDLRSHTRNIGNLRDDIIEEKITQIKEIYNLENLKLDEYIIQNSNTTSSELIFNIINQVIASQIGAYKLDRESVKLITLFRKDFENFCETLIESAYIAKRKAIINNFIFEEEYIKIPKIILEVVLVELLINMKKHSPRTNRTINIKYINKCLILTNNYEEQINGTQKGIRNCMNIISELNKKSYEIDMMINDDLHNKIYSVTINFNKL